MAALAGCVTGAPGSMPSSGGDTGAVTAAPEAPAAAAPALPPSYCSDDIYARYLMRSYSASHAPVGPGSPRQAAVRLAKTKRLRASRRRYARLHRFESAQGLGEAEAMSFARTRFSGPTTVIGGALPVVLNSQVDLWVRYFTGEGRRQFMQWLVRSESVKPMVAPLLQAGGIPMEFFHLAMIESGLSNAALSSARAMGTWQFISGTAQLYGLKINHWVDERRDPVKSTVAAAAYLKDLYAELGDWHLAMAAYNAGPGTIRQAIRRGKSRDFWTLANAGLLPLETKHYVTKVMAAILLSKEADRYGFTVQPNPQDIIPTTGVHVAYPVRLSELAAKLTLPLTSLMLWNPEITRNITPPRQGGYPLRLPQNYADQYATVAAQLTPLEVRDVQIHHVRKGETLAHIARLYKVALKQILAVNPDLKANRLKPGTPVAIPIPGIVAARSRPKQAGEVF